MEFIFHLMQLAADMQRFSRPERRLNGPTITHLWYVVFLHCRLSSHMLSFSNLL